MRLWWPTAVEGRYINTRIQYDTIRYNAIQYNTMQRNTILYNTILLVELKPLSLLQYLVPDRNRLPPGIEIVYDEAGGVHAFRFQPEVQAYSFPAASLFTQCDFFPEEFSVLMTLKMSKATSRSNECIFALIATGTTRVKVGVQLRKGRLQVDYVERSGKRRRMTEFKSVRVFDDMAWHSIVLVVTSDRIGLRVDCGKRKYRRLRRRFPSLINAKEDNLHIANCNSLKRGVFTVSIIWQPRLRT